MEVLHIKSSSREELVNVTLQIQSLVREKGWRDGMLLLFCPHTTGAVTINEAADPDVARDIAVNMRVLVPRNGDYRHMEGNSDAHIKSSLFGPDQLLIVGERGAAVGHVAGRLFL